MSKGFVLLFLSLLVLSLLFWISNSTLFAIEEEYVPNDYERNLIEYFKEIALNTEYDDNPNKVIKWRSPMLLFVYKENECSQQIQMLNKTISSINDLVSDGFRIELTDSINHSNAVLYLCKRERVRQIAPKFYELLDDEMLGDYSGMTYVEFSLSNYVISKALIYIDEEVSIEEQKSAIVEEITQSIGLLNDSNNYLNSIFYDNVDTVGGTEYSNMDIDLIKYLYSENMKPGYSKESVELVLKRMMRDRPRSLN